MVAQCIEVLKGALSRIEGDYFSVPTASCESKSVRERVFCYELYHQLRSAQEDGSLRISPGVQIHGEIDKRGRKDYQRENPDFIFHAPGTNESNILVVEVKGTLDDKDGIEGDFDKLLEFVDNHQYQAGAFVLFNHSIENLCQSTREMVEDRCSNSNATRIHVLAIKSPGADCQESLLSSLCNIEPASGR